eukprot:m.170906 g.170906  ORF g.170906 m.170906 type:complete len:262 (-) comp14538_c1_seq2:1730-2515(-)
MSYNHLRQHRERMEAQQYRGQPSSRPAPYASSRPSYPGARPPPHHAPPPHRGHPPSMAPRSHHGPPQGAYGQGGAWAAPPGPSHHSSYPHTHSQQSYDRYDRYDPAAGSIPAPVDAASASVAAAKKKEKKEKKKKVKPNREGGGEKWHDPTMDEWDPNDYRIFCGDLGNEVTDDVLAKAFQHYPSFQKARVVRDVRTKKCRGFGFVSFKDGKEWIRALKEMNGKYIGNRPVKLTRSTWKERDLKKKPAVAKRSGGGSMKRK